MELCSRGHEEVCFEGRDCPACAVRAEMEQKIDSYKDHISSLQAEIALLNNEIYELEKKGE